MTKYKRQKYDVVSFGQSSLDDIENVGFKVQRILGGAAIYFSLMTSNLGLKTGLVSRVGLDFNDQHIDRMKKNGIDLSGLIICPSLSTRIHLKYDHERLINLKINENISKNLNEYDYPNEFFSTKISHISTAPYNSIINLCEKLREKKITISMDPHSDFINNSHKENKILIKNVDILFMNYSEYLRFTQKKDIYELVKYLKQHPSKIFNINCGKEGSIIIHQNNIIRIPSFINYMVIDCVGAGDVYAAGFIYGYLKKTDLYIAGLYGAACAYFTIGGIGTKNIPTKESVVNIIKNSSRYLYNE